MVGLGATADSVCPTFWLMQKAEGGLRTSGVHLAFQGDTKEAIQEFHREAINAGFLDNGLPGPRPQYTPTYYAAFVKDIAGNNIEAVLRN